MNCIDNNCRYLNSCPVEWFCELTHEEVPDDINVTQCDCFVQANTCIDCAHSKIHVYETGTIDDIEYRCPFQNNKLIYDDLNPCCRHYFDVPECGIGKFEEDVT